MAIDLVARLMLDDQMTASLNKLTVGSAASFAAITAGAAYAIKEFTSFDDALRKAGAIAGASASELDAMRESAIQLGADTSKGATEVADAMADLAANGFDANQVIAAMPGIIAASEASAEDLALAADTVSSALNIWSLEAAESTHVADVLAMAANVSAAGIMDLSYAFKYAGAPAAALGISLEETAAAVGLITNAGIDGSTAGTALRSGLMALASPLKKQSKLMDKIGFSANNANGSTKSLSEMMRDLGASLEGMTASGKVGVLKDLVGTEGVSAFLSLLDAGPDKLDEFTKALVESDGAAAETAAKMMSGIGGAFEEMGGTFESLAIRIGDALEEPVVAIARFVSEIDFNPILEQIEKFGAASEKAVNYIIDNWSKISPILTPVAAGLGVLATALFGIGALAGIFTGISAVIAFITGPIGLIALGITAIGIGFMAAYKGSEQFRNAISRVVDTVKALFTIATGSQTDGSVMLAKLGFSNETIAGIFNFINAVKAAASDFMAYLSAKWTELQPTVIMLGGVFENVKSIVMSALTALWSLVGPMLSLLGNALKIVGDIAVMAFNNIIAPALLIVTTLAANLWKVMGPVISLLGAAFEVLGVIIKWLWDTILKPFVDYWTSGLLVVLDKVMPVLSKVGGVFETIGGYISTAAGYVRTFADLLKGVKVPDWFSKVGGKAVEFAGNLLPGHYNGLERVPYDNYVARLHQGERVLNRFEADDYDRVMSGVSYGGAMAPTGGGNSEGGRGDISISGNTFHVRQESDIEAVAMEIARLIEREGYQMV
ncbi:phage tail tape measure protein [Psychrobacillus sp. OK032]|uniref:phage tail tape measure protein n=1 Tax=Psychrobacillus sp. OK032 TaxID=1884358 RepID=UPI0008C6193B|nr:phage tail tape measure protein [Psychrobacillus sp. OK032]SER87280.1 phage tail tape measure protein, TP901 family, core region [Psychrobacillus sp. OK032]